MIISNVFPKLFFETLVPFVILESRPGTHWANLKFFLEFQDHRRLYGGLGCPPKISPYFFYVWEQVQTLKCNNIFFPFSKFRKAKIVQKKGNGVHAANKNSGILCIINIKGLLFLNTKLARFLFFNWTLESRINTSALIGCWWSVFASDSQSSHFQIANGSEDPDRGKSLIALIGQRKFIRVTFKSDNNFGKRK